MSLRNIKMAPKVVLLVQFFGCPSALQGLKLILKENSNALTFLHDFYETFMVLQLKKSLVKTHEHENINDAPELASIHGT